MGSSVDKYYEDLEDKAEEERSLKRFQKKEKLINEINELSPESEEFKNITWLYDNRYHIKQYFDSLKAIT